ncbi:hypothetical protein BD560DRAFT_317772, partial [Blakeslea trispora]
AASNAKINFHKVRAFSLSGRQIDEYWLSSLQSIQISKVWTTHDPSPLIYLGFPLIQSKAQRDLFLAEFLLCLKRDADLHSCRSLSCWFLFRVLPIPKSTLQALRSLVSSFINRRIFPRLGWHVLTASKKFGGLGLLDPELQQSALYYRWLDPLL